MVGSHEELYRAMETDRVDLVLNDQRRAFSDRYNNEILAESRMYIEISSRNTLGRLEMIDVAEVKNIPCILMIHPAGQKEEQTYYEDVIGIKGDYLFADSVQEARLKIITGQGYMPVDVTGDPVWSDSTIDRIPLVRNGDPVRKTYCAFWRKDNSGYYIEDFSDMLKEAFACFIGLLHCTVCSVIIAKWLMNQKQIHIVCFQFLQGFLNRSLCFFISCIADPDLCGNEKFLSWQTAFYNCLTYAFFIAICLSSINATISVFNCSKHAALCFFRGSLINAIAKLWHFHTII